EPVQRKIGDVKSVFPVFTYDNMKTVVHLVAAGLDDLNQFPDLCVQRKIPDPVGIICPAVLQGHGIGQFVVGQHIAAAVHDISSGAFYGSLSRGLQRKIVRILLSVDNLQRKNPLQKYRRHHEKTYDQNARSRQIYFLKCLFYLLNQGDLCPSTSYSDSLRFILKNSR